MIKSYLESQDILKNKYEEFTYGGKSMLDFQRC